VNEKAKPLRQVGGVPASAEQLRGVSVSPSNMGLRLDLRLITPEKDEQQTPLSTHGEAGGSIRRNHTPSGNEVSTVTR
jgi:hypothetical protein